MTCVGVWMCVCVDEKDQVRGEILLTGVKKVRVKYTCHWKRVCNINGTRERPASLGSRKRDVNRVRTRGIS